jgi:SSS family solute:Na+ symporter
MARAAAGDSNPELMVEARWVLANSGRPGAENDLAAMLDNPSPEIRGDAAYALGFLAHVSADSYQHLVGALQKEPVNSAARVYLLSATFLHSSTPERQTYLPELLEDVKSGDPKAAPEACKALARDTKPEALSILIQSLNSQVADIRSAAANAILHLGRQTPHRLTALDWVVISLYGLGMLSIGLYFLRKNKTAEDYLLGGRRMSSWAVGLSLFASLISTISYLSMPGEMIRYGPMIMASLAFYPLVVLVVGWLLIPYIMKLKITSAYEILELRFGLSVRMLGSLFFLSLRVLWMAMITYVTVSDVLVPIMGVAPRYSPLLSAILVVLTVTYTSLGGLRAVIVTDVAQTFILLGAAVLAIVIVTIQLHGFQWWPTTWSPHWEKFHFWFVADSRLTFMGAALAQFCWYICTCGSDQIAIQRYLSTRNVKSARKAFITNMVTDTIVMAFLGILGFAMLGYFRANPHLMAEGQAIADNADQLFPQFIVIGLPTGLAGLVVSGLLSAAMSSFASGINSTSSVITVDFVERFRATKKNGAGSVRMARYMSWLVGLVVFLLSSTIALVSGNLTEVGGKVVNVLVAPLFILFYMAMFVPWATTFGTWVAALASLAVSIGICYWNILGISFIWGMPASMIVGAAAGMLASLAPIGVKPTVGLKAILRAEEGVKLPVA